MEKTKRDAIERIVISTGVQIKQAVADQNYLRAGELKSYLEGMKTVIRIMEVKNEVGC